MGAYCTVAQARTQASNRTTWDDAETDALTLNVSAASRMIDRATGTWHDKRTGTLTTQACQVGARRLFVPAPCLLLTAVTEDDEAVDIADVKLCNGGWWLEKADGSAWSADTNAIVLTGDFGRKTVGDDVVTLAAEWAAVLSGLKSRSFNDASGATQVVTITKLSDSAQATLEALKLQWLSSQPWTFEQTEAGA